jgi:tryptophan-rich sensory protein
MATPAHAPAAGPVPSGPARPDEATRTDDATDRRGARGYVVLGVLLAANAAVAAAGSISSIAAVDGWYADAEKVPWTPPNWLFGPAWTVLYVLMAVAAWLVWRADGWEGARRALTLYVVQLTLNAAWTPVFFGGNLPWAGLAVIVALDAVLIATAVAFWRHSRLASWLLGPYITWVLFATTLNAGIAVLN